MLEKNELGVRLYEANKGTLLLMHQGIAVLRSFKIFMVSKGL